MQASNLCVELGWSFQLNYLNDEVQTESITDYSIM